MITPSQFDQLDEAVDDLIELRHQKTLASSGSSAEYDEVSRRYLIARNVYVALLERIRREHFGAEDTGSLS